MQLNEYLAITASIIAIISVATWSKNERLKALVFLTIIIGAFYLGYKYFENKNPNPIVTPIVSSDEYAHTINYLENETNRILEQIDIEENSSNGSSFSASWSLIKSCKLFTNTATNIAIDDITKSAEFIGEIFMKILDSKMTDTSINEIISESNFRYLVINKPVKIYNRNLNPSYEISISCGENLQLAIDNCTLSNFSFDHQVSSAIKINNSDIEKLTLGTIIGEISVYEKEYQHLYKDNYLEIVDSQIDTLHISDNIPKISFYDSRFTYLTHISPLEVMVEIGGNLFIGKNIQFGGKNTSISINAKNFKIYNGYFCEEKDAFEELLSNGTLICRNNNLSFESN